MANEIVIKGAREHNLKDVDLIIPRDELVVITGLSGSGKSSLAFDTMYAEGQRRYVESLSSYARMFLGQMSKPDVDSIDGLSPAVSIDQKTTSKNPRSTVGTTTEIYDYLRLLFARVGVPHCPECGREIKKQTTDQVTDDILRLGDDAQGESTKAILMAPVVAGRKGEFTKLFADLQKEGFSRVRIDGEIVKLTGEPVTLNKKIKHFIDVVVDRVTLKESAQSRIAEAVELACKLAGGRVLVQVLGPDGNPLGAAGGTSSGATGGLGEGEHLFSLALACPEHGHSMDELQPRDFSFNAPYGACPDCLGIGSRDEVDPSLVVPDPSLTLNEGVIAPFKSGNYYPQVLRAVAQHVGTDADTPWEDMPKKAQKALLHGLGNEKVRVDYRTVDGRDTYWYIEWEGVLAAVKRRYTEAQSDAQREKLSAYFATVPCETCGGKRLKPEVHRGHGERQVHPRRHGDVGGRVAGVLRGAALHGPGGGYRPAHREGDPRAAALPRGRGPGLPHAGAGHGHALRRRGPAHPARHPDRRRAHGRALHSGRALHRASPARQRAAHRHAGAPARPGQHRGGRGARRGHHPGGRLRGGHGPGRRRARRPRHRGGDAGRGHGHRGLRHGRLPVGAPPHRGAGDASQARARHVEDDRRQGEQPEQRHTGGAHRHAHRGHGRLRFQEKAPLSPTRWHRRSPTG